VLPSLGSSPATVVSTRGGLESPGPSRLTSRHSTSERRVLRSSPLRRGPWPSCCVKSVAPGSAQSCTSAHSRLASLQLGASRVAQRRCVMALGRPAACMASRLVQLKAARRTTAASRHSTSERRVLRSSPQPPRVTPPRSVTCCAAPLRRGPWPSRCVHSVAPGSAQSCTADHSRLASLHLGASRAAQLAAALRPLAVLLGLTRTSRAAQLAAAASRHFTSEHRV